MNPSLGPIRAIVMVTNIETRLMEQPTALLRLMQLASPSLPVGSYAYSQGLESAIEAGWISDKASLEQWLQGVMTSTIKRVDIPLFKRLYTGWQHEELDRIKYWNNYLVASRETMELRNEEQVRGMALWNLLQGLGLTGPGVLESIGNNNMSYLCAYTYASSCWCIDMREAALAYVWGWAENQVLSAIKLMPIGQLAGQTLLGRLMDTMTEVTGQGMEIEDDQIGALLPACTMASVLHETQYSRLFRS